MKIINSKIKLLLISFLSCIMIIFISLGVGFTNVYAISYSYSADVYFYSDFYPIHLTTSYNEEGGDGWDNDYYVYSSEQSVSISSYYSSVGGFGSSGSSELPTNILYKNYSGTYSVFYSFDVSVYNDDNGKKGTLVKSYSLLYSDLYDNTAYLVDFDNLEDGDYIYIIQCNTICQGWFTGVENGGRTSGSVSFSWSDDNCTATLDGKKYIKNSIIDDEGTHSIVLGNNSGIYRYYTFTIDRTAPTGTFSGVSDGGKTNSDVSFTWTDSYASAKLNDVDYTKGTSISEEGEYTIVLTDDVGNSTTYTFTIDKTAPIISMYRSDNSKKFSDGEILNCYPYFSVSEDDLNSVIITDTSNDITYDWLLTSTQTVYYDTRNSTENVIYYSTKDALIKVLKDTERSINLFAATNYTSAEASHIYSSEIDYAYLGCNYFKYYYTSDGTSGDYYIFFNDEVMNQFIDKNINNFVSSTSKTLFIHEGSFVITATDNAGNITTKNFTVDLTPPTSGTLSGVADGGITNQDVSFTWGDDADHATLNKDPYVSGTLITNSGKYTITLYDKVNNFTTYTFTIRLTRLR